MIFCFRLTKGLYWGIVVPVSTILMLTANFIIEKPLVSFLVFVVVFYVGVGVLQRIASKKYAETLKILNEKCDAETYLDLQRERDMLRAIGSEDFAQVKPKFREQVYGMLDRGEKAAPVSEQLNGIREKYEEYFTPEHEQNAAPKNTPQYSQQPGRTSTNNESEEDKLVRQLSEAWK